MHLAKLSYALLAAVVLASPLYFCVEPANDHAGKVSEQGVALRGRAEANRPGAGLIKKHLDYRRGDVLTFQLRADLGLAVEAGEEVTHPIAELQWSGQWEWVVVESNDETTTIVATFLDSRMINRLAPDEVNIGGKLPMPGLMLPHRATLTPSGEVLALAFSPETTTNEVQILKTVWAAVSLNMGHVDGVQWLGQLRDGQGAFEARFTRKHANVLEKTKVRYTDAGRPQKPEVLRSKCEFSFDESERISALKCDEELRVNSEAPMPTTRSKATFEFDRTSYRSDPALADAKKNALETRPALAIDEELSVEQARAALDESWMRGESSQQILDRFGTIEAKDQASRHEAGELFFAATAMLRQNPAAREEVFARIKRHDKEAGKWLDAVGESGGADNQERLRLALVKNEIPDALRTRALLAIVSKGQPSEEVVDMLIESRDDPRVARQARYSLGAAARHLAKHDPQRSNAIVQMLIADLQAAPSDDARRKALIALVGNTSLSLVAPCLPFLHSDDPSIRARAAEVLGYVTQEEVALALSSLARSDRVAEVRMEAIQGLGRQLANPRWLEIFVDLARRDKAPLVRAAAVSVLGNAGYRSQPDAVQALTWVAEHDPHVNVRTLAGDTVREPV